MFQTYGIDIRGYEKGALEDIEMVALLTSQLPRGARVWAALNPDAQWTMTDWLLNSIDIHLRTYLYAFSEDAKFKTNQPEAYLPTQKKEKRSTPKDGAAHAALPIERLREITDLMERGVLSGGEL